ncbi:MAG: hypothetical protein EOM73_07315 [Bacteroidia bacterium]|nr:hypothetical protein [Bacteroidia bacterium]
MTTHLPDIFMYNPTCEYAVANGNPWWQPNRLLQKMEADMTVLPLFLAEKGDVLLVGKKPSFHFLETLSALDIGLPEFIPTKEALKSTSLQKNLIGKLKPWGWSPATHRLLSPLKPACSTDFQESPVAEWKPEYREFYSRRFALKILKHLLADYNSSDFIPEFLTPKICTTQSEIEFLYKQWGKLLIKAPWSSSGRGLQPVTKTPVHPKVWEKLLGIINSQGFVMVEPLLEKALDLAFQFEISKGKISYLGISNFVADSKGQYAGNHLNGLPENLDHGVAEFAAAVPGFLIGPLIQILENSELAKNYEGNFGVDTLIFYDQDHKLKINPCLEINLRQNMGLVSLSLEKIIHPEKKAMFRTYYHPGISFFRFKKEMEEKHPAVISQKKLVSGFLPLTDTDENTMFGAYLFA